MLPSHWMNPITSLWRAQRTHTNPHKLSQANWNHTPMHTLQGCPQLGCSCIGNVALQQHIQCGRSTLAAAPASLSTPTAPQRAWPLHSAKPNLLDPLWTRALGTTPTSAVCTLHPASCDEILMSLAFFCEELCSPRHKGASYSLCMFPSLLSTCPLAQYHSNSNSNHLLIFDFPFVLRCWT